MRKFEPYRRVAAGLLWAVPAALLLALPGGAWASNSSGGVASSVYRHAISAEFFAKGTNGYVLDVVREGRFVGILASTERPPMADFAPSEGNVLPPGNNFSATGASFSADEGNYAASVYTTQAEPGSDPSNAIDVDLGSLGRISVVFVPSGAVRVRSFSKQGKTKNCNAPSKIVRRLGKFEGTISFRGENGYTTVDLPSAEGSIGTSPRRSCSTKPSRRLERIGKPAKGAFFRASDSQSDVSFSATTPGPRSAGRYFAISSDTNGDIPVFRIAVARAPSGGFVFDDALASARISPPPPFAGAGVFEHKDKSAPSWTGSLGVAFPGVEVPLAGPSYAATLRPGY